MAVYQTPAIVLRRTDSVSVDRLYAVLTPDRGKLTVLAKGTKRVTSKLAGSLEPPRIVTLWIAEGRQIDRIIGCVSRTPFSATRRSLWNSIALQAFLEGLAHLVRGEGEDQPLFRAALQVLEHFEASSRSGEPVALIALDVALWRIVHFSGYRPNFTRCAVGHEFFTERRRATAFAADRGGFVCEEHATAPRWRRVPEGTAPLLIKLLTPAPIRSLTLSVRLARAVHTLTVDYLEQVGEQPFASEQLLRALAPHPHSLVS